MMIKDSNGNNRVFTPTEIKVNNETYIFISNVEKKARLDIQKAAELNGYRILFVDNASNMYGESMLETHCSAYLLKEDFNKKCSINRLLSTTTTIAIKYKEYLLSKGYDIEDVPLTRICLGCEKHENFPMKK